MMPNSSLVEFTPGEYPALLALTCVAIYGCVPETGQMPAMGAMVACLFLIEVSTRASSVLLVKLVAALIVLWSGLYGATGRGSAVVGAWFAFWPLVLVVGCAVVFAPLRLVARWIIGIIGGVAAVAVARTGGIEPTTGPAIVAVALAVPLSMTAAYVVVALSRRIDGPATRR